MTKGFTLIELLVVVAIIAMLTAGGFLAFTNAQRSSRDARRRADLKSIVKVMEQYATTNGGIYPVAANYAAFAPGVSYFPAGTPVDPKNTGVFVYSLVSSATTYCVCAAMEVPSTGNATAVAAAACPFGAPPAQGYYCQSNQQ